MGSSFWQQCAGIQGIWQKANAQSSKIVPAPSPEEVWKRMKAMDRQLEQANKENRELKEAVASKEKEVDATKRKMALDTTILSVFARRT